MHTTYTRKAHGINKEAVRNMYGKHEVLRTVQLLWKMRKEHGCHKETAWVNKQRMKSCNTTPPPPPSLRESQTRGLLRWEITPGCQNAYRKQLRSFGDKSYKRMWLQL